MRVEATIVRVSDGASVVDVEEWADNLTPDNVFYQWSDGNYSCDCNRHQKFEWGKNGSCADENPPCGDGVRYRVTKLVVDGVVIAEDAAGIPSTL